MAGKPGRSGRKRKPAAIHKLHGNYRADRHGGSIPDPPVAIPDPPKMLRGIALQEWDRITKLAAEVKIITQLDMVVFASYCKWWSVFSKAIDQVDLGRTYLSKSTKGTNVPHPLLRVANLAWSNMMRCCGELGFSPAARARLNIEMREGGIDPLEHLIRNQAERRAKRSGA